MKLLFSSLQNSESDQCACIKLCQIPDTDVTVTKIGQSES